MYIDRNNSAMLGDRTIRHSSELAEFLEQQTGQSHEVKRFSLVSSFASRRRCQLRQPNVPSHPSH